MIHLPKRNIITNHKIIDITSLKYKQYEHSLKPNGLWYSLYSSWFNHITNQNMDYKIKDYIHKIDLNENIFTNLQNPDPNKILLIKNLDDVAIFTRKYKIAEGNRKKMNMDPNSKIYFNYSEIDWKKVAKDYGGIEFYPYIKYSSLFFNKKHLEIYIWYSSIDISSGCIWNTKPIIQTIKLLYKFNLKTKHYIPI
jgi:hypothetical protein